MTVVLALPALVAAAAPLSALADSSTPHGHVQPPIHFQSVSEPVSRTTPGKGGPVVGSVIYTPANIRSAYNFGSFADGAGRSIAIVDAYGDNSLSSDLAAFDTKFGLPAPAALNVSYPLGAPSSTSSSWAVETALDVEWAHASAPNATIDLVIVPDSSDASMLSGVEAAVSLKPTAMSMSWDDSVANFGSLLSQYEVVFNQAQANGTILFAAAGDSGAYNGTHPKTLTVVYPASSAYVIGVGGTTLKLNSAGGYGSETAWSNGGGGYSSLYPEPSYQSAAGVPDSTAMRGVPDVAFDADTSTAVYVNSGGRWYGVGGTSVGSPNWAAIAADNAAHASPPLTLSRLYGLYGVQGQTSSYGTDFHDIASGSNGYYSAAAGWDAVTGLGSANVSDLITTP